MNVIFIVPRISGPRNRVQYQRAKLLCKKYSVTILMMFPDIPKEIEKMARKVETFPLTRKKSFTIALSPFFILWTIFKTIQSQNRKNSVVWTAYFSISSLPGFVLKMLGFRWIADIYDHPYLIVEDRKKIESFPARLFLPLAVISYHLVKTTLRYADLVISAVHPNIFVGFDIDTKKLLLTTNGVDLKVTRSRGLKKQGDVFKVVYVGLVTKNRGIDAVLLATSRLIDRISSLKIILIGPMNGDKNWIKNRIKMLGIAEYVKITGKISHDEVLRYEENADVCLFPFPRRRTLDCIYPVKIFEYMAMGKVIVATNLRGVREILIDNKNGLLVRPDDPEDLAETVIKLYQEPGLRRRLGVNARATSKQYSWDTINEKISQKIDGTFGALHTLTNN